VALIGKIPSNLKGLDYKYALENHKIDTALVPFTMEATAPKRRRLQEIVDDPHIDGDLPIMDDEKDDNIDYPVALFVAPLTPNVSSSSSTSSSSSSKSQSTVSIDGKDAVRYPKFIFGRRVRVERHAASSDAGLRMSCPHHGGQCRKFRGLKQDLLIFGTEAPVIFLKTWCAYAKDYDLKSHKSWNPTTKQMREYVESKV
jgi:hypothetical protein